MPTRRRTHLPSETATHRQTPRLRASRRPIGLSVGLSLALALGPGAAAAPPENLREELTDHVGVVTETQAEAVAEVQDRLVREKGLQLFVVVVDDFDGQAPATWLEETARLSGLGEQDLAVAVSDGTRELAARVPDGSGLVRRDVDRVVTEGRARLAEGDTAGAVTTVVDGLGEATQLDAGQRAQRTLWWLLGIALVLAAVGTALLTLWRRARRRQQEAADLSESAALMRSTGAATVALDDAVARAEEEAQFASAEFDAPLVASVTETVDGARDQALEAHRRRAAVATGPVDAPVWQVPPHEAVRELRAIDELTRTALDRVAAIPSTLDGLRRASDLVPGRIERLRAVLREPGVPTATASQVGTLLDRAEADVAAGRPEAALLPLRTVVALLGPTHGDPETAGSAGTPEDDTH